MRNEKLAGERGEGRGMVCYLEAGEGLPFFD